MFLAALLVTEKEESFTGNVALQTEVTVPIVVTVGVTLDIATVTGLEVDD